ncbi:MAG: hypothetical protein ABSG68_04960 [Thermoguttaceae bacterium]|jgi:hypothetical protein
MCHFSRRSIVALLALTCGLWLAQSGRLARAAENLDAAQIKAVLRTTDVEDGGFIQRAINLVDAGKLPYDLVQSSLQWARKKPHHKFQYFKAALTMRAAQIGVQL